MRKLQCSLGNGSLETVHGEEMRPNGAYQAAQAMLSVQHGTVSASGGLKITHVNVDKLALVRFNHLSYRLIINSDGTTLLVFEWIHT